MNTIGDNTPERFAKALRFTKNRLLHDPNGPRVITINFFIEKLPVLAVSHGELEAGNRLIFNA